jgi:dGTPase
MITPEMLEGIEIIEIIKESIGWGGLTLGEVDRHRLIRRLVGILVTDAVDSTSQRIKESRVKSAIGVQKLDHNLAGYSENTTRRNRELKDFLYAKLYRHHRVVRMSVKAERIITDLFKAYCAEPAMLASAIQSLFDERGLERTICDYLAGMTDRYAIEEHGKLFDPISLP